MTSAPVFCNATVDPVVKIGSPIPLWKVVVTGLAPHAYVRVYEIASATDGHAAQEGMRRFIEEFSSAQT